MLKKAKIRFVEFVRPDSFWPHPHSLEQAFQVFRWMVKTGSDYQRPGRWGSSGPIEVLSGEPTCLGALSVKPIKSVDDLRSRFHFAILSADGHKSVNEWRAAHDVGIGAEKWIMFPHHRPFEGGAGWFSEAEIKRALDGLFRNGATRLINRSLNQIHKTANACKRIEIQVDPDRFVFRLWYGFADEGEFGSCWLHTLAITENGEEAFIDTLRRAVTAFDDLTSSAAS